MLSIPAQPALVPTDPTQAQQHRLWQSLAGGGGGAALTPHTPALLICHLNSSVISRIPKRNAAILSLCLPNSMAPAKVTIWGGGSDAIFPVSPHTTHRCPWRMSSWKGYFCHCGCLSLLRQIVIFRDFVPRDYLFFPVAVSLISKLLFVRLYLLVFCFSLLVEKDCLKQRGRTHF